MSSTIELWLIIITLGVGSFAIRFTFLGVVGDKPLPPWLLRHLRYTAVAVLPALVAPLIVWPAATNGEPDMARIAAAAATFAVGYLSKNVVAAITAGAVTLYGLMAVM